MQCKTLSLPLAFKYKKKLEFIAWTLSLAAEQAKAVGWCVTSGVAEDNAMQ